MAEVVDDLRDALRWALEEAREDLGVFRAGGTLGFEPEDHWKCHGCSGDIWVRSRGLEYQPPKEFPHDEACRYMKAVRLVQS